MRHYSVRTRRFIFLTFIFIIIRLVASCNAHRPRGSSILDDSFNSRSSILRPLRFLPSPVTARDLTCSFELSDVRRTRVEALSIVCDCVIMVTGHQSDVAEVLCCSEPQDILISFADWTLAIIDPLKSSGLSPGKRPGSFGVSKLRSLSFNQLSDIC